jgi:DNA-binding transcriptional regulator YhcF (GntR family)
LRITLTESSTPLVEQIRDQIRGLITAGVLAAQQRLPSVRQLASDLKVAPGTVAKAYRTLEEEGVLVTKIGSGTRVSADASATPKSVLEAAIRLAEAAERADVALEEAVRVLGAVWPARPSDSQAGHQGG